MTNESIECPLCMEPMDFDDVDFYPCPCRYQICRFCWDKIINEENGLCPACRKPYNSENPASYKPRTEEEIKNKIKHSKKICPKKTKTVLEGKEYLSEYRVLQKNLIFVVGLPMRMAEEVELLKGQEYFGKCGKVYKIVINQNQTFPGPQGTPCLSAYVTYHRNDDALKTLVDLKKLEIDGRAVKLSLGTTKYCSQFLRNRRCTKQDCMYLHEMGEQAASFTKEDMANGRHTEYENQLIQEFFDTIKTSPLITAAITTTIATVTTITGNNNIVVSQSPLTLSSSPPLLLSSSSLSSSSSSSSSTPDDKQQQQQQQQTAIQRKLSVSSSSHTSVATTTAAIASSLSSTTAMKPAQRSFLVTPIGTDPNDATKIHSLSSSLSENYYCKAVDKINIESLSSPLEHLSGTHDSLLFHSNNSNNNSNTTNNNISNSLLDSFYYLNSQTTTTSSSSSSNFDHNQQINNNNSNNIDFSRSSFAPSSFTDDYGNMATKVDHKDTADIDFDPINISRIGLAELIANENRQKMSNQMFGRPHSQSMHCQRPPPAIGGNGLLRQSTHDYISVQSNGINGVGGDYYNNQRNNQLTSLSSSSSSYLLDNNNSGSSTTSSNNKVQLHHHQQQQQQQQHHNNSNNHHQSQSVMMNGNTAVSIAPVSSGFPSPPPGFEVNHHHHHHLGGHHQEQQQQQQQSNNDMMSMLMNHSNTDIYNHRYQQHSEIPMNINNHNSNGQFSNQYSMPSVSRFHSEFNSYSNGGGGGGGGGGYGNDIISSQQQPPPWKTTAQSLFCDGGLGAPQDIQQQQHSMVAQRPSLYNRSHSVNEGGNSSNVNGGLVQQQQQRLSDWNGGFSNYNNNNNNNNSSSTTITTTTNDSHMSNYHFY